MKLLVFEADTFTPYTLRAGASSVKIGRAEDCDVKLIDPAASRYHAVLHLGPPRLEDLGSVNGTFLDQERLDAKKPVPLRPRQSFFIAGALLMLQGPGRIDGAVSKNEAADDSTGDDLPKGVVARDPATQSLFALVRRVARGHINVLVLGETGAGKEIVAEAIHHGSPRRGRPFVRVNCAALPEPLLESELFGHERGAFTGAVTSKPGVIESANGGTVFLDEVGELTPVMQAKLLRMIEAREVQRLGSVRSRSVDVRFVSATNRDLATSMARGFFRTDLFFRLNGVCIAVPPLRARPEDVIPLAESFAATAAKRMGLRVDKRFSVASQELLRSHAWPGNARELRNAVERAVLLGTEDVIQPNDFGITVKAAPEEPEARAKASSSATPTQRIAIAPPESGKADHEGDAVDQGERRRILDALNRCCGNQTRAAKLLGMPRRTLVRRLASLGLPRPRKPGPS